ncbi:caffeoylshikimate esterase [Phalaenopsis equestris]|uniref:caffeoylshikimate esterase n=1 Tax=Phalaenopsis equestris TaxID=78828 RepID=UPI0009E3164B|nr:caffeoylshikimate esterase [Phalaenopsis equestris]
MPAAVKGAVAGAPRNFWGDTPPTAEEYYASQGINATKSFFTSPHGVSLFTRSWMPLRPPRAAIFMIHGYGNDISWTFQSTPIFLARSGFACFALDLHGHGYSSGIRAFVPDLPAVADDCITFFRSALSSHPSLLSLPKFLYGESMGGALCLLIHLRLKDLHIDKKDWSGAVLVAPMCKISDKMRPRWPIPQILTLVARFLPALPVVPTGDLVEKSVKVKEKRVVAMANPMRYNGKPRLGTVVELLRATDELSRRLAEVSLPFLVLHGSGDVVTDPAVSRELYEVARSVDKSIKIYDGVWHSLQFGETEENVEIFRKDVLNWLDCRCGGGDEVDIATAALSSATV